MCQEVGGDGAQCAGAPGLSDQVMGQRLRDRFGGAGIFAVEEIPIEGR
jgi:hypothetical protein